MFLPRGTSKECQERPRGSRFLAYRVALDFQAASSSQSSVHRHLIFFRAFELVGPYTSINKMLRANGICVAGRLGNLSRTNSHGVRYVVTIRGHSSEVNLHTNFRLPRYLNVPLQSRSLSLASLEVRLTRPRKLFAETNDSVEGQYLYDLTSIRSLVIQEISGGLQSPQKRLRHLQHPLRFLQHLL